MPAPLPDTVDELGAEFRRLRAVRGHFGGGTAGWIDEVDSAGGRKEVVMHALGERLGDGQHMRDEVERVMGPPDRVARAGDWLWTFAAQGIAEPMDELLVYQWRGDHDVLYFRVQGGRVLSAGWWMAYE